MDLKVFDGEGNMQRDDFRRQEHMMHNLVQNILFRWCDTRIRIQIQIQMFWWFF